MKIAIFSDIHGNLPALKSIINDIKKERIDEVICLGDVIGIGPNPKECLDLIIGNKISLILGNHELYYLLGTDIEEMGEGEIRHQQWVKDKLGEKYKEILKECPLKIEKEINNKKYLFQHFMQREKKEDNYPFEKLSIVKSGEINKLFSTMNYDYIFIGHEHKDFTIDINENKLIDVGSSGCRKDNITKYTILEINDNFINVETKDITYDKNYLIEEIKKEEYPDRNFIAKIFFGINLEN